MNQRPQHAHHAPPKSPMPSGDSCCGGQHTAALMTADKPYTDPVCGMKVAANPEKMVEYQGTTYYFCSTKCVTKFRADPTSYLDKSNTKAAPTSAADQGAIYTCPMHPEVRQVGPGNCPICGMALEPLLATAEEDTSELDDMTRRFKVSVALSLPLLLISMSDLIPALNLHHMIGVNAFNWLQAALATPGS